MGAEGTSIGLCLLVDISAGARERLGAILQSVSISSIVVRHGSGAALTAEAALPLVEAAHKRGAAALIEGDVRLARTLEADGVYLPWSKTALSAYEDARGLLGDRFVVGADAGKSRHDAMSLAEAGADFIGFGAPREAADQMSARERRLDLVRWWGKIFEVPCVAFDVLDVVEARELAECGADFIAVTLGGGETPADTARRVAMMADALKRTAVV